MNNTGKVLGLGVVALGGWLLFGKKTPAPPVPEEGGPTLVIIPGEPYYSGAPDGYANITPSPLVVGTTGNKAIVTVTNNSVYAGTAIKAPCTFKIYYAIQVPDGTANMVYGEQTIAFAKDEQKTVTFTFNVPATGYLGVGKAYVYLKNPADPNPFAYLAMATIAVTVNAAAGVNVTLRARNAPGLVKYWIAMCATYPSSNFVPKANPIVWNNIPANTSQQWVIFGGYDANFQPVSTPNAWVGVGFSTPFQNGKTYYWDFATGILLDENFNWM